MWLPEEEEWRDGHRRDGDQYLLKDLGKLSGKSGLSAGFAEGLDF